MRLLFSYIFFLLLSTVIIAQTGEFRLAIEDHQFERVFLSNEISEKVLDFEDSKRDDAFGMLPVYVHRLPLNSENVIISASIAGEENIIISATDINTLADIDKIGDQFQLSSSVIFVEGKPYADITILPYRKGEDGTLEALVKGIVSYELTETSEFRAPGKSFVENSVLASGQWYRISTQETGIFKISYDELSQMGIPMSGLDPRKIRLFGNGNGIIPEKNSDERYDDLLENAIYVHGEEDGVFDEDDYILFYGQSSVKWNYVPFDGYSIFLHELNPYTIHSYYFINIGDEPGKRISSISNASLEPTVYVSEFTDYAAHENEAINILKTGREWYGETYSDVTTHEYSFSFPNICTDYLASLSTNIAAHSTIQSNFDYYYGDQHLLQAPISKIILGTTVYAWTTTPDTVGFYPESDDMIVRVEYDKPTTTSKGWMNYISLNVRRKLIFTAPFVSFRDHLSYGPGEVAEYKISGVDASLQVWDVTDPFNISAQEGSLATDKFTFRAPADEIREFIAFDKSGFHSVEFVEAVANQNLHGYEAVDYIIVSHPDYLTEAQRMISLHSMVDNMSGFIVTPQQVYNEFSSGKQDPSAIRDFIRMLYENADSLSKPKYLLLMGDASYDYMDRLPDNTNMVPAYQSAESLKLGYSFVTDDYFGLLDPGEGVNGYGKSLEIGIGRFPVHTIEQAEQMVDKVEAYLTLKPAVYGSWRNLVGFIADDEDQNLHFNQAEKLEYMIDTGYHQYNCPKIYLDAFPQESTPSGHVYPEVNEAIDDLVESGCLIVNYTGHGGERGWAHEGVLDIATIINWSNWSQLPLFITATCEFSRYDDPSMISAGEWVFLNPYGGGIGLLTTSRLAWADPNFRLNKAVYQFMFKQTDGEFYKVGDVVRLAKTDQNNGTNIKNFVLLGDPAMRLAYPELRVQTLAINGEKVSFQGNDTLKSMAEVEIHGVITDFQGDTMTDFNGILIPRMLDKDVSMSTLGNDPGSIPAQFTVLGQQLTSGKVSVNDGFFTFSMFMPQNMASNVGYGKISYYAYDSINLRDAHGYSRVKTGGVNPNAPPDNEGPELSMYMNNTDFVSGDLTTSEPVFLAYLNDEHGINFTGNGIGRDIAMTLDNDPQTTVVLNKLFDPDLDNYQGGWISYPLSELEDGMHTITLKAWDNMNISSERSISFEVNSDGPVNLTKVYTYPNPFTEETSFTFDHNKPGNSFDIKIDIFNINGQRVRTLYDYSHAEGLGIDPIIWDGTDEGGSKIGPGIYIYRMYVTDEQGNMSVQTSKLIFAGGQN